MDDVNYTIIKGGNKFYTIQKKLKNMTKTVLLFLISLSFLASCDKPNSPEFYTINGEVKNYNGKVYLYPAVDTIYYSNNFKVDSTIVKDGKFKFKLSKRNKIPLPFRIRINNSMTTQFILEPKNQLILIDGISENNPKLIPENTTIREEHLILQKRRALLNEEFDANIEKIYASKYSNDSIEKLVNVERTRLNDESLLVIRDFTKDYPDSYVSFWYIVLSQTYNGFNVEIENAFNNLSPGIKNTKEGEILKRRLLESKVLQIGTFFPELKLKNKDLQEIVFNTSANSNANYILVDFWYSHCGPCIAQFPKLKKLYNKYNPNSLKIISISTDMTKNIDNWYKVMEKYTIPWINVLDENGTETSPLGIKSFPTNYLLNNEGVILRKNISLTDLELLLKNL